VLRAAAALTHLPTEWMVLQILVPFTIEQQQVAVVVVTVRG
jgi:hypothetical protein